MFEPLDSASSSSSVPSNTKPGRFPNIRPSSESAGSPVKNSDTMAKARIVLQEARKRIESRTPVTEKTFRALPETTIQKEERKIVENCVTTLLHMIKEGKVDSLKQFLALHPHSVRLADCNGCLALHLALMDMAPDDVITIIFEAYPEAAKKKDSRGCLPVQYAGSHSMSTKCT